MLLYTSGYVDKLSASSSHKTQYHSKLFLLMNPLHVSDSAIARNLLQLTLNTGDRFFPGGGLSHYYSRILEAPNVEHGYHGLTHMLRVTWFAYLGAKWSCEQGIITPSQVRNEIISGLFHDYDHSPKTGNDHEEIERALQGLNRHILDEDRPQLAEIEANIRATLFVFPPVELVDPTESQLVLSDADIANTLQGDTWQQLVLFGLGREMGKTYLEMIRMQSGFIRNVIKIKSKWGQQFFTQKMFEERLEDVAMLEQIVQLGRATVPRPLAA